MKNKFLLKIRGQVFVPDESVNQAHRLFQDFLGKIKAVEKKIQSLYDSSLELVYRYCRCNRNLVGFEFLPDDVVDVPEGTDVEGTVTSAMAIFAEALAKIPSSHFVLAASLGGGKEYNGPFAVCVDKSYKGKFINLSIYFPKWREASEWIAPGGFVMELDGRVDGRGFLGTIYKPDEGEGAKMCHQDKNGYLDIFEHSFPRKWQDGYDDIDEDALAAWCGPYYEPTESESKKDSEPKMEEAPVSKPKPKKPARPSDPVGQIAWDFANVSLEFGEKEHIEATQAIYKALVDSLIADRNGDRDIVGVCAFAVTNRLLAMDGGLNDKKLAYLGKVFQLDKDGVMKALQQAKSVGNEDLFLEIIEKSSAEVRKYYAMLVAALLTYDHTLSEEGFKEIRKAVLLTL